MKSHHHHHDPHDDPSGEFAPGFPPPPGAPGFGFGFGGPGRGGFPPFGPGRGPRGGPVGRRGGRRGGPGGRRGNVRAAVLALLAEEPRHGYSIMNELAERSGGLWRPSPGSVYPVLSQLEDEGLVTVAKAEGRRVFTLTDAGRTYVAEHTEELTEPWQVGEAGPRERVKSIMVAMHSLGAAAEQVARFSDDAQAEQAVAALETARKALYRILAGEEA
jgi:DNA-binding PadR family transcriptional regulator